MNLLVAIPTVNRYADLRELLQRLLGGTGWSPRVLVVDDGSTDETHKLLESYAGVERLHVIRHQTNLGLGAALLSISSYAERFPAWTVLCADDDIPRLPDLLRFQRKFPQLEEYDFVASRYDRKTQEAYRGGHRQRAIRPWEFRLAASHLPGLAFRFDRLPHARSLLAEALRESSSLASIYPQWYFSIDPVLNGRATWIPEVLVSEGASRPSGIRDPDNSGRYSEPESRVGQSMSFLSLINEWSVLTGSSPARRAVKQLASVGEDFLIESLDAKLKSEILGFSGLRRAAFLLVLPASSLGRRHLTRVLKKFLRSALGIENRQEAIGQRDSAI